MSQPTYLVVSSTGNTGRTIVSQSSPPPRPHALRIILPGVQVCEKKLGKQQLPFSNLDIQQNTKLRTGRHHRPLSHLPRLHPRLHRPTQPARPIRRRIRVPLGVPGRGRYVRRAHQHHGAERESDVCSVLCAVALCWRVRSSRGWGGVVCSRMCLVGCISRVRWRGVGMGSKMC